MERRLIDIITHASEGLNRYFKSLRLSRISGVAGFEKILKIIIIPIYNCKKMWYSHLANKSDY